LSDASAELASEPLSPPGRAPGPTELADACSVSPAHANNAPRIVASIGPESCMRILQRASQQEAFRVSGRTPGEAARGGAPQAHDAPPSGATCASSVEAVQQQPGPQLRLEPGRLG